MLVVFTDTDMDVTPEIAARYGFRLVSMPYSYDEKTIYPYEDFDEFDGPAFYDMLRSGVLPSTSAISGSKYRRYFEPVFAGGDDILYLHFSAAMTMTFSVMDETVAELLKEYPERRFYSVDTKAITIGSLNIALEVGEMYKAGATAEEIRDWVEKEADHFATYFFADDLKFFRKSGRVSGLKATMGTLLGVRPLININSEGKMGSIGSAKGRAKAIDALLNYVDELGQDIKAHRIVIGHTDVPDIVAEIRRRLTEKYGSDLNIVEVYANPTSGSHCGPNSCGISFYAKHR